MPRFLLALLAVLTLLGALACSRHLELYEPSDAGVSVVEGPKPPDDIPEVTDSGVRTDELLSCAERPTGDCVGANDFPCDFPRWVERTADACTTQVDCLVQGWLGVALGADGCVDALEMTDPNPDFVACLVEQFAHFGCVQCTAQYATRYLGTSAEPCMIQCINDPDCPSGYACTDGTCVRELH
jgi:hypothetical protein